MQGFGAGSIQHWFRGRETDEGWCSQSFTWAHEGNLVRRVVINDGVDCDGRLTHTWEDWCSVESLESCAYPDWKGVSDHVYDHYAQASGY